MDHTDPFLLIAATSVVGVFLAPLASRLIAQVGADVAAAVGDRDPDPDLSRIRSRRRG